MAPRVNSSSSRRKLDGANANSTALIPILLSYHTRGPQRGEKDCHIAQRECSARSTVTGQYAYCWIWSTLARAFANPYDTVYRLPPPRIYVSVVGHFPWLRRVLFLGHCGGERCEISSRQTPGTWSAKSGVGLSVTLALKLWIWFWRNYLPLS
jgi:hypothetical protein